MGLELNCRVGQERAGLHCRAVVGLNRHRRTRARLESHRRAGLQGLELQYWVEVGLGRHGRAGVGLERRGRIRVGLRSYRGVRLERYVR